MPGLAVLAFGGNTHEGAALTDPVVEIWECTLAVSTADGFVANQAQCDQLATYVNTWFTNVSAGLSSTESLDFVKWNDFDLATGHQITDPTLIHNFTNVRGPLATVQPVSTTCRISIDNGTRNQRAKGGFYPPRMGRQTGANGRISNADQAGMVAEALILFNAINTYLNGVLAGTKIGVWSRRDHLVHISTRLRVGDVPDNISRRRNHLRETYQSTGI